jgi:hypothetical protein
MWYSRKYDMSPMPHSLFFRGGYAIHGTGSIRELGGLRAMTACGCIPRTRDCFIGLCRITAALAFS